MEKSIARRWTKRNADLLVPYAVMVCLATMVFQGAAQFPPLTPQQIQANENLQDASDKFSLHADLPFLSQSHHRIWYIWLVISFVCAAFVCSMGVVIAGLVKWRRRRGQLKRLREEGKLPKGGLEAGKLHGLTPEDLKGQPLKIFKPSDEDLKRLEKLDIPEEELFAEKSRRTAKHEKPLHTLQALHRMKSF
ncbi:g11836 [Coccomyxa viridis]|uniref:G11836 protein n=1 Tax=Coccomyxa viridis TaxID=1274662 RepID=A0ABP1G8Z7_9CHLO